MSHQPMPSGQLHVAAASWAPLSRDEVWSECCGRHGCLAGHANKKVCQQKGCAKGVHRVHVLSAARFAAGLCNLCGHWPRWGRAPCATGRAVQCASRQSALLVAWGPQGALRQLWQACLPSPVAGSCLHASAPQGGSLVASVCWDAHLCGGTACRLFCASPCPQQQKL
jgi:hypothetical protein